MTRLYDLGGSLLSAGAILALGAPTAAPSVMLLRTCLGGHVAVPNAPGAPPRREDGACHAVCPHRRSPGSADPDGEL